MTSAAAAPSRGSYDGERAAALAERLALPAVIALESVGSTLDVAHELAAAGAPAGTLVVADTQTAGRGRGGKRWSSGSGDGIWLTLIERDLDPATLPLLALRLGITGASALEPFAAAAIGIKWPNDLFVGRGKLAGILAEARWRDASPEWVAVGMGVNVRVPEDFPDAAGLRAGVDRRAVLAALVPALRAAAARHGSLTATELAELARRDVAHGRAIVSPERGVAQGVSAEGELLVLQPGGATVAHRAGSLIFAEAS